MSLPEFRELIVKIRKEKKLSLRDASALMGISHSYLDKLEKGFNASTSMETKPSADAVKAIANAYKINYDYLMELCGYIENSDPSLVRIMNPDILTISRAERNFTPEQAEAIRKYAEFMFPEAFKDEGSCD